MPKPTNLCSHTWCISRKRRNQEQLSYYANLSLFFILGINWLPQTLESTGNLALSKWSPIFSWKFSKMTKITQVSQNTCIQTKKIFLAVVDKIKNNFLKPQVSPFSKKRYFHENFWTYRLSYQMDGDFSGTFKGGPFFFPNNSKLAIWELCYISVAQWVFVRFWRLYQLFPGFFWNFHFFEKFQKIMV